MSLYYTHVHFSIKNVKQILRKKPIHSECRGDINILLCIGTYV